LPEAIGVRGYMFRKSAKAIINGNVILVEGIVCCLRLPLLLLVCVRMTLLAESRLRRVYKALVDGDVVADSKILAWGGWGRRLMCQNSERRGRSNHHLRQRKLTMPYSSPASAGIAGCNQTRAKISSHRDWMFCAVPSHYTDSLVANPLMARLKGPTFTSTSQWHSFHFE
jgi:hypothetical protein